MKNKACLALMEQLVMVLVFALSAALCLGIFAQSSLISQETARREEGALLAQNAAELLKSGADPHTLDTGDLTLTVLPAASPVPGYLNTAAIVISYEGETVFQMETAWQEGLP